MPEKTAESFRDDGFFITGDMAQQDENGYITIVGRDKDLIISGGLNVYPKEVEGLIDEIDGVLESAVIGVPHRDFGEAVVAVVVPSPASSEVWLATVLTICAPMFWNLSFSSISFATETPSLVTVGDPKALSSTTLRPFGPSVTLTALAKTLTPSSISMRASSPNFTSLALIAYFLLIVSDS